MNANSYAKDCTARCLERLRDVGDRTLSNVGFSVTGENAVAFGALLMDTADEIERLNRVISETQKLLDESVAREAAFLTHHCESEGCAVEGEYTTKAARWADQYHAMKAELAKVLQQQAEADNERDAVEEGLRAYAGEATQVLEAMVAEYTDYAIRNHLGNPEKQHNIKWARTVLAKNPNPAGLDPATEASGSQATEASGAGRAGTELTGAQALGDSAGADPAFTGSPAVGTKASSGATNPTVGNCHETNHEPGSLPPRFKRGDGSFEDWYESYFYGCSRPGSVETDRLRHAFEAARELRHQSGKKSDGAMYVTVPVMPTDAMLEALYGPYLSPTSHATRRAAWAEALAAVPPPSGIVIPPIGAHPELAMAVNQPPRSEFQVCNSPWVRARDRLPTPDDVPFAYRERDDSATYCVDSRGEFDSEFGTDGPPSHIVWMKMPRVPDDPADLQFVAGKKS